MYVIDNVSTSSTTKLDNYDSNRNLSTSTGVSERNGEQAIVVL